VIDVLSYLVAMNLGLGLYADRAAFRVVVVQNDTDTPFITADQPVINLHATFDGKPPEKLEFYYPLSPTKAMLLVEPSSGWGDIPITSISVNNFNTIMVRNSHEQVFSNSKEYLTSIKKLVGQLRT